MNARQHNYSQIAQKTKQAFKIFSKRLLAKKVIEVLSESKIKPTFSEPQIASQEIEMMTGGNEVVAEENEGFSKTIYTNHRQTVSNFNKDVCVTKITQLKYGDYVVIDIQMLKDQCRIYSHLQSLKVFNIKEIPSNIFSLRKSAFQIECPALHFRQDGQKISSRSMVCLKNVFTGYYVHLSSQVAKSKQFGYQIQLKPVLQPSGLFKLTQGEQRNYITTDLDVSIVSYYRPDLKVSISEENILAKTDRFVIGSYSQASFKIAKLDNTSNLKGNPFYYIKCMDINKNLQVDEPSLQRFTVKKQIRELSIEQTLSNEQSGANQDSNYSKCEFFELTPTRQSNCIRISPTKQLDLSQIWQVQKIEQKQQEFQCRVKNVISNQQLGSNELYRKNYLLFKKHQNNYMIVSEQNEYLAAIYEGESQSYMLSFKQWSTLQNESSINKMYNYGFVLVPLEEKYHGPLYQLIQINQLLKYNYPFIQKWGFHYEDRVERVKYSLIHLKKDIRLMSKKIVEIHLALDKLLSLLSKEQKNIGSIQNIAKHLKLLELLIIYSQIIKIKIGKPSQVYDKQIYKFASFHLKPTLFKLFDLILLLTKQNQLCSQVIIQHNIIFNQLLKDYCEPIGAIIEQAIKNLCLLTSKIREEQDVIFSWTAHVEQVSDSQLFQIQKQYIDIIAQVVIDPNDIGIHPYQNKIKEQLIGNRKKKIIPKFALTNQRIQGMYQPLIIFEYDFFPVNVSQKQKFKAFNTAFQVRRLFRNRKDLEECKSQIAYISSMLKLMRNLCKQKNKKLARVMEDYGLSAQYLHCVFKNQQISWEIIIKFLDLYSVMYLVQDPFLSFDKRQVKCFSWQQISNFDFSQKTGILFCQFTEQNAALSRHIIFEENIKPIFDKYLGDLSKWQQVGLQDSKIQGFYNILSIIYQVINYGYLDYKCIQRYVSFILRFSERALKKISRNQMKEKIVSKVMPIFTIAQEISAIVQSMNLLQLIYQNFKTSKLTSNQYLASIFTQALSFKSALQCKSIPQKRKTTYSFKGINSALKKATQKIQLQIDELDTCILQYTLRKILENKCGMNNQTLKSLLNLLEITSKRGERICSFLNEIFILDSQAESLYLQFSGIIPAELTEEQASQRKLLNVMKVKELVDKITEQNMQTEDEGRKRQKLLQLKNVLMKIIKKLQLIEGSNYNSFRICQNLFRKLKLHCMLTQILKFSDKEYYQALVHEIITFLLLFIQDNKANLQAMAPYLSLFTKRYSFSKLPYLLPPLFSQNNNQEESFWLIYRNIDKKMDENQKEILFHCIYNICQICPPQLLENIKGQVVYNLITNNKFEEYVKGTVRSPNFINILCFIGSSSMQVAQRIKECVSKTALYLGLTDSSKGFILKSIYLKLYHFLYLSKPNQIDDLQCQELIDKFFLAQLKHLPSSCHSRASLKLEELKYLNKAKTEPESRDEIEAIISGYSKLMMQGSESVATSEQEHYFLFLLNIDNQNQLSLLMCLKQLLVKYQIRNIQPLASYIFQLINFMEKLFLTKEKIYQSRILNKLYEISTIIQQKYKREHRRQSAMPFKSGNQKVWNFYTDLVKILVNEKISFYKLLECGKVSAYEIEQFRNGEVCQKLILQSQFLQFINSLIANINDREKIYELTSEAAIKQFFIIYSEKGTHKINIVKFISKLIQMLQNEKSIRLCAKKKEEGKEVKDYEMSHQDQINYELFQRQIFHLNQVLLTHFSNFMTDRIKSTFQRIFIELQSNQSNQMSLNCFQTHLKNKQYSIMNVIVCELIKKIDQMNLCAVDYSQYLGFLFNELLITPTSQIVSILSVINYITQDNRIASQNFFLSFKEFINKWNQLILASKFKHLKEIYSIGKQVYTLAQKIVAKKQLSHPQLTSIISIFTNQFVFVFSQYIKQPTYYWASHCQISLSLLLGFSTGQQTVATILSQSHQFIRCFNQLLNQVLKNTLVNTNKQVQQEITIMNNLLRLVKKMRSKDLFPELSQILVQLPYQLMIETFDLTYSYLVEEKSDLVQCNQQYRCSKQFCNEGQLTDYDKYILEVITNILLIVHIASHILLSKANQEMHKNNKQILQDYQEGKITNNNHNPYKKYSQIIKEIETSLDNKKSTFYFSSSLASNTLKKLIVRQVQEQIIFISKHNFFQNLYNLSYYVERKYEEIRIVANKFWWCKFLLFNPKPLHSFFVIYLMAINCSLIFYNIPLDASIKYIINTAIILIKLMLFSIQCRNLYYKQGLQIQYTKNFQIYKYFEFVVGFLTIVSYCMQYAIYQFYPITLALELWRVKMVKKICMMILSAAYSMAYIVIFLQSILFCCSLIIYSQVKATTPMSLISIFFNITEELILIQFLPIETKQSQRYSLIKKVPEFIPVLVVTVMSVQAIVLAKIVQEIIRQAKKNKERDERCQICEHRKQEFQLAGKRFINHITNQHNIWHYIQFFIYIRNKKDKQIEENRLNQLIEDQNFKFLKV